jgi:diguanylate cyclase (GGDEF)-like protein
VGVRTRTILFLLTTAVVLWAALQVGGILLGDRVSNQIDEREATANASRAASQVDYSAQQLMVVTNDWALWDDTYNFMHNHNSAYVGTNLTDQTLSSLGVDFIVFADSSGRIVASKAIDPDSRHGVPLPAGLSSYLATQLPKLHLTNPNTAKAGAANLSAGPLLLAVQPISNGDGSAPSDGLFITGSFLSQGRLAAIRKLTLLPLDLRPTGTGVRYPATALAAQTLTSHATIPGLDGRPALVAGVTQPRTAFTLTRTAVLSGGAALGIFGLILVVGLGLTLDTVVLPDHLRAQQSQMILDTASASMDRLRDGLTPGATAAVCQLILEHSAADAVMLCDTARLVGFAGVGADHHTAGSSIKMTATREAIRNNTREILRSPDEIGCSHPQCLLKAGVIVPLQIAGRAGGTLELFFTSPRKLDRTSIALADGLARVLSIQLELDRSHTELSLLAAHDPLTGLANRRQFEAELERELSEVERLGGCGALLWFDLDHFKDVNDSLGHAAGDDLLVAFAKKIKTKSRDYCTVARVGGDEFAMLVPHADEQEAKATASRLLEMLSDTSFAAAEHVVRVSASIGIARFPDHGTTGDELMACADLAMYEAKTTGGDRFFAYTKDDLWRSRMTAQIETAEQIRRALRADRFQLYAQPLRRLADNAVPAYELLLRMIGEDGEVILPAEFIPTAERLGVIRDIDRWVARRGVQMLGAEQAAGRDTVFAINMSGAAFSDPELLDIIREELAACGAAPSNLVIEITETTAIADMDRAQKFIGALTEIGCRFSLDDFGSGASSFYYLKHLPIDFLKIDGTLVKGLSEDSPDMHFVRAIIEMCRGLKISTVAEWVENPGLLDTIEDLGADFAQGYEVGWPRPLEEYTEAPASLAVAHLVGPHAFILASAATAEE